jgi:hypothetical protein
MWSFKRGLDISVFMLDILTVIDNRTTRPGYFCSDFVGLHFLIFLEEQFRARTSFTRLLLSSRIGAVEENPAV